MANNEANTGNPGALEATKALESAKSSESVTKTKSVKELENRFSDVAPTVLGAGNVWGRYKKGMGSLGVTDREIYDPFLKEGVLEGKDKSVEFSGINSKRPVVILTPAINHVREIDELVNKMHVPGIYCEKPSAISGTNQAKLDEIVKNNPDVPIFFADHYYYKHIPLFALMGVKDVPFKGHVKIIEDQTGRLQEVLNSGQSIIGKVASIEAALVEGQGNVIDAKGVAQVNAGTIDHRKWLGVRESGGGMLLDLLVHLNDGTQVLGHEIDRIDSVFLGTHTQTAGKYNEIKNGDHNTPEDYAEVKGTTKDGVKMTFRVGKFAAGNEKFMLIKGENGSSIRADYSATNTVTVMDKNGEVVGKAELPKESDPFLLAAAHGFEHLTKGKGQYFLKEQRNSVLLIQKLQEMVRGTPDIPEKPTETLVDVMSAEKVQEIEKGFVVNKEKPAKVLIETEKGKIEVEQKGGKVTSWKVKNSRGELQEIFYQGSEKRTGMPILFPWYRKNGDFRQHGFGRDVNWIPTNRDKNSLTLSLNSVNLTEEERKMYPHDFEAQIEVEIDEKGDMTYSLAVKNTGSSDLPVAPGLHPNFAIAHEDKKRVKIKGIDGFDAEKIDWDNNPPDAPIGASEAGEFGQPPFSYKEGGVVVSMPWGEISLADISSQGPQMKYWNVWADKNPKDLNFITPAEPLTRLDDAITKDPIKVAPGATWNWTMKFSASFS